MNCRNPWNREFLDQHLTRTWREGDLKAHRTDLLFDRERSLLPITQEAVTVELQKRAYALEIDDLCAKQQALKAELEAVKAELDMRQQYIRHGPAAAAVKERRRFIAACPSESCRGFLSTAYKCGTCQVQFCADCRESRNGATSATPVTDAEPSAPKDADNHECDPALVATIQAIVKDSRPCPTCGMAISKVDGCDQMFCTQCDTSYSYQTGKVVTGVIHNPHYFEKMRKLNNGVIPRQPGDCNAWPVFYQLPSLVRSNNFLRGIYQSARHLEQVGLREYANPTEPTDNTDLRIRYLLNEITEARFKQIVQQRDRKRQRELEIRGPLELFVVTAMEFFRYKPTVEKGEVFKAQIDTLVNAPLRDIGERYGNRVPQFDMMTGNIN
jgi:hypothetical protein